MRPTCSVLDATDLWVIVEIMLISVLAAVSVSRMWSAWVKVDCRDVRSEGTCERRSAHGDVLLG
jgi:hypothetical protein